MNDVQIFNNPDFGEVKMVLIDNEPWFVAIEIAKALGYAVPKTATAKVVDEDDMQSTRMRYSGQEREILVINESGLYSMIFRSKLESAKQFKKWVTSEVLPSIRKTGGYGVPQTIPEQIQLLAQGNVEINKRVDEVREEVKTVKEEIEALKDDLPLFPSEADEVKNAINRKVVSLFDGKDSNAYHDRSLVKKVFADCYKNVKHNFGDISTYKAIKRGQRTKALQIIAEYKPPFFLAEQIANANAQQTLDLEGVQQDER